MEIYNKLPSDLKFMIDKLMLNKKAFDECLKELLIDVETCEKCKGDFLEGYVDQELGYPFFCSACYDTSIPYLSYFPENMGILEFRQHHLYPY